MTLRSSQWGIVAVVAGCAWPATHAGDAPPAAGSASLDQTAAVVNHSLSGTVDFRPAATRRAQATMTDVAIASTVSLIDTNTNTTVATSLTDSAGNFLMTFPPSFTPTSGNTYLLEAIKGLNHNLPANNAARIRTIVEYSSGWLSITNATTGIPIGIGAPTTALAVGAQLLDAATPSWVPYASLIGRYNVTDATYSAVPNLSGNDYGNLLTLVNNSLAVNGDPVASIQLQGTNTWAPNGGTMKVSGISSASGSAGTALTISGSNFPTAPSSLAVSFGGGFPVFATSWDSISTTVIVPYWAISGPVTVAASNVSVIAGSFTMQLVVNGISPAAASPGATVKISGSGFGGGIPGLDQVVFSGVSGTATASVFNALASSFDVVVPQDAKSGPVTVTVAGQTAIAPNFTVN